jgi:hypothetical protein
MNASSRKGVRESMTIMQLIGSVLKGVLIFVVAALYFAPLVIASARGVSGNRCTTIVIVNLLLGWTGIGWLVVLVWALCAAVYDGPSLCPFCAEVMKFEELFCGHCGRASVLVRISAGERHSIDAKS